MKRGVKRSSADLVNILAGILDSEQNFNRSAVPMVTADCGFMQILDPDFGFLLLGSSGCGRIQTLILADQQIYIALFTPLHEEKGDRWAGMNHENCLEVRETQSDLTFETLQ